MPANGEKNFDEMKAYKYKAICWEVPIVNLFRLRENVNPSYA